MSDPPSLVRLPAELHLLVAPSLNASDLYALIRTCRTFYKLFLPSLQHLALVNYGDTYDNAEFYEKSALVWACRDPARIPLVRSIFEYAHTKASPELKRRLFKACHLRMLAMAAAESGNAPALALLIDEIETVSPEFCLDTISPCYNYAYVDRCDCDYDDDYQESLRRRVFCHQWGPLQPAACWGHADVLTLLFKRVYADMGDIREYSQDWLLKVAISGQIESFRLLIQACPDLRKSSMFEDHAYPHGPLHTAAALGCLELAHFCLDELGVSVDVLDRSGQTALYYATENVGRKQYANYIYYKSRNPVLKRDKEGVKRVAKLLVSRGAKVSCLLHATADFPLLHFFCRHETDIEMLEILLSASEVDCSAQDKPDGLTPLHYAVQAGSTAVVERLLAAGADANIPTRILGVVHTDGFMFPCLGRTPVHYAVVAARGTEKTNATSEELLSLCRTILAAAGRPGVSTRDSKGCTALHLAAGAGKTARASISSHQTDGHPALLRLVLGFGAGTEINTKDNSGRTPLHYAAAQAAQDIEVLLSGCAGSVDINARDNQGRTPLHSAATRSVRNVELLLSAGADPAAIDDSGRLPLHYAETEEAGAPAFFALLDASSDPNADILLSDKNGRTPLIAFLERLDFVPLEPLNQIIALCRERGLPAELPRDEDGLILGWYKMEEDGTLVWEGDGLNAISSGGW